MNDKSKRLLSLDVFRGLTIAGMILVNSPGNQTSYASLDHAEWNGLTPTDLVFPFFVFIVGISLVFSLSRRIEEGLSRPTLLLQVIKRAAILFGLGLLLNGYPKYDWATIRILGVLQRIALCYFLSALFFLYSAVTVQIGLIVASLVGYWWLMTRVSVPGLALGDLSQQGNLAAFIDRLCLPGHLYRPSYDPEGLLSTIPAMATGLLGNLTGYGLKSSKSPGTKVAACVMAGAIFLLAGWKWGHYFPINKALWTSSYVLVSAGWALLVFAICFWLIEIQGWRRWSKPLEVFGLNAIAAYFLHVLFLKVQNQVVLSRLDGRPGNLRLFLTDHLFAGWLSPKNASLAYALAYMLFWLAVCWNFYRRKLFIKI